MVINNREGIAVSSKINQGNLVSDIKLKALEAQSDIINCLRSYPMPEQSMVLAAYLLARLTQLSDPGTVIFQDVIDGRLCDEANIIFMIEERLNPEVWERIKALHTKYSSEVFALAAMLPSQSDKNTTPESVSELVSAIMGIQPGDSVADIGCGSGAFLMAAASVQPSANFYGYEINTSEYSNAIIRSQLSSGEIHIQQCDAFALASNDGSNLLPEHGFSRVFSNYPFGMRVKYLNKNAGLQALLEQYPDLLKATSADWAFNALLLHLLAPAGKAIGISTNGSTWNATDTGIRRHFVENGFIEAVIALPERLFNDTGIPTTLLILSRGNKEIRLIDATKICQNGRRNNFFSNEDISIIVNAIHHNTEYSKIIGIEELRKNGYALNPGRYMGEAIYFENGVPFGTIIEDISRGAPLTASELDSVTSATSTNIQYLKLSSIQNGVIDNELPYLSSIDPRYDRHCLKSGSIVLSKIGSPYKVAVASVEDGKRILASGNLYIINLDQEKANPYYVKAFLESERGMAQLDQNSTGAAFPTIGVDRVRSILIPLPSMEEQARVATRYLAAQDEVQVLRRKLEIAQDRLQHLYDTESEATTC